MVDEDDLTSACMYVCSVAYFYSASIMIINEMILKLRVYKFHTFI